MDKEEFGKKIEEAIKNATFIMSNDERKNRAAWRTFQLDPKFKDFESLKEIASAAGFEVQPFRDAEGEEGTAIYKKGGDPAQAHVTGGQAYIDKLGREALQRRKKAISEEMQKAFKAFRETAQDAQGVKQGSLDLAEGKISGAVKLVKPLLGQGLCGLSMKYGKSAADRIFKGDAPPQGPTPAPEVKK